MAQFGADATQLSGPSMAGTAPVSPVQEQYVNTNGAAATLIEGAGSIFESVAKKLNKDAAKEAENTAVGGYIKTENQIADAVKTGQITPSAGAARSRANFSQYAASHPQYIKEFKQAGEALKGYGDTGEVQRQVEEANDQRKRNISEASQRGFVFPENAPKEVVDAQIASYQASVRADEATRRMIQENQEMRARAAEGRAQSAEERTIMDRQRKEASLTAINEIAGSNINSYSILGNSLVKSVSSGQMPVEQAQQLWAQQGAQIQAAIQSAASLNPELANGYRSVFSELDSVIKKQIDPKTRTEQAEDQVKAIIAQAKLIGLTDPKVAAQAAANQLFPNSPELAFKMSGEGLNTVTRIANTLTTDGKISGFVPQVVGNPEVEKPTLDLLRGAISKINGPNVQKKDVLQIQTQNSVNVILKQTGDLIDKGVDPASLKDLASFFASPEYGQLATTGKLDKQSAQTAKKTFQLQYEPAIIQGVQEKMDSFLYNSSSAATGGAQAFLGVGNKPKAFSDTVDVVWSGSGIQFKAKGTEGLTSSELANQKASMASLDSSTKAINQLIHIGAHMEDSTDYQKYWEANKHIYMPKVFSKYSNIPMGMIKDSPDGKMRFVGPNNDKDGWVKVE